MHTFFKKLILLITAFSLVLPSAHLRTEAAEDAVFSLPEGILFFGESTTAHLCRRGGVLDTKKGRRAVLRDESGTRALDRRLLFSTVLLEDGEGHAERVTVREALAALQPTDLVLSFGLNGIRAHARDPERFLSTYRFVLDSILAVTPDTEIFIQSVYPVGENTVFEEDASEINRRIRTLNDALRAAARDWGDVVYLDTAALLLSPDGTLRPEFDAGDGIHLTNAAYTVLLTNVARILSE